MKKILPLVLLLAVALLPEIGATRAQTASRSAPAPAPPEAIVRGFYAFYLGQLNKDNWSPLKDRREALKYLTPKFLRAVPRLAEKWMADPIICAQDWDKDWAKTFTVGQPTVRGSKATVVVRLPPFGGGADNADNPAIKIKATLAKRREGWRISGADCVN
jgi:hypothetical protein